MTTHQATRDAGTVLSEEQLQQLFQDLEAAEIMFAPLNRPVTPTKCSLISNHIATLTAQRDAALERDAGRQDWAPDDVEDAVMRVRELSERRLPHVIVSTDDMGKLFASADGVADSYSILLEHTTGLSKPTTDPKTACALADDRETERYHRWLADELVDMREAIESVYESASQWISKGLYTDGLADVRGQLGSFLAVAPEPHAQDGSGE